MFICRRESVCQLTVNKSTNVVALTTTAMTLLKVLLRQETWTPLHNNIAACCLTVLYGKLVLEGVAWLRLRFRLTQATYYSKQLVYMLLSGGILFWPLFDRSDWSWRLNIVLPAAMLLRFVYKVCIISWDRSTARQTIRGQNACALV